MKADKTGAARDFRTILNRVETGSMDLYNAQIIFDKLVIELFELYRMGKGNHEQRAIAVDHFEDATLIPFRKRDKSGNII